MILSICPNTAIDRVILIDRWTPGKPMRMSRSISAVGGKGLNSAVVLSQLGVAPVAMGFFSGNVGKELVGIVEDYGITTEPIWVDGDNRVSLIISERETHISSYLIVGEVIVSEDQKEEFLDKFQSHLPGADFVILAGTIPQSLSPGFYAEMIPLAKQAGVPVLLDAQKQFMVEGIKHHPEIVKMNWEEFEWTFDLKAETLSDLITLTKTFHEQRGLQNLVITLGKQGILSITQQGTFLTQSPLQTPVNAAGAGDSVSAVLAWRLSLGDHWESALRWSGAVSAATVLTERTGEVRKEDIDRILPKVKVERLS